MRKCWPLRKPARWLANREARCVVRGDPGSVWCPRSLIYARSSSVCFSSRSAISISGEAEDFFPEGVGFVPFRKRDSVEFFSSPEFDGAIRGAGDGLILSTTIHVPLTTKQATNRNGFTPCRCAETARR